MKEPWSAGTQVQVGTVSYVHDVEVRADGIYELLVNSCYLMLSSGASAGCGRNQREEPPRHAQRGNVLVLLVKW